MQLVNWQEKIQKLILDENPLLKNDPQMNYELKEYLQEGKVDVETRLSIYTNAYVLRLIDVLKSNYPAVHQLLGDEDFDVMAMQYLQVFPPIHTSIRWFGEFLPQFFSENKPYNDLPVIIELAHFEWAFRHSIDAADAEVVSVDFLQKLSSEEWGNLTFSLHPSVRILSLQWNSPQIWQALNENNEPPQPTQINSDWLVYRQTNYISAWRSAVDLEMNALNALDSGKNFADICEVIAEHVANESDVPSMAAGFLRAWVEQGIITFN